ncbi:hypothetical protein FACS189472_06090 [Alphaproteobacteria bacterium]|nr:hypothetical protein FACS189472_06090 [Alphaproteobacteria bacterium]
MKKILLAGLLVFGMCADCSYAGGAVTADLLKTSQKNTLTKIESPRKSRSESTQGGLMKNFSMRIRRNG